jgi:predicted transcriptional regulator
VPIIKFGWDKQEGRHVFMGEKSKEDSETRKKHDLIEVANEIFSRKSSMTMVELTQSIMEAMDVKDRMARNYIKYMKENSIIEKNALNSSEFILPELPF